LAVQARPLLGDRGDGFVEPHGLERNGIERVDPPASLGQTAARQVGRVAEVAAPARLVLSHLLRGQ